MSDLPLKVIDPHLHLFNLQQGDYQWLKPDRPPLWPDKHIINQDFTQYDLSLGPKFELAGFVHIEAGFDNHQPWREIDWLEQQCKGNFKTVAFADITSTSFAQHLHQLKQRTSVVGIRHILDDQAQQILSSDSINSHFALLAEMAFSFDAQISLTDNQGVALLVGLAKQYKTVSIIINHGGWPPAENKVTERKKWMQNLQKLAECENIAIKLSGWEMSNRNWQPQHLATVLQDCLELMGDTRVMLASNFPLCLFSMSYCDLWNTYAALPTISNQTFEKLTFSNAKRWYRF